MLHTITVILHVFVCFFLIAVILLQAGRGQGLSWGSFGGSPQSILGTKTATFLAKVTTGCASIFLISCIALNVFETHQQRSLFGPRKSLSQVDFQKIKQALEKAQKETTEKKTTATESKELKPEEGKKENSAQKSVQTEQPVQTALPVVAESKPSTEPNNSTKTT